MPRQARNKGEYSVYHVIQRGNERKNIFVSSDDKSRFLDTLQKMKEKYNFIIHGYCIMDNHVHLIINDNGNDISKLIKSINISYAFYYNYMNNRCGHLFQDRFLSERIAEDAYLLQVSKYIHNNPVKAGMVEKAGDYKWSSHNFFTGKAEDIRELVEVNKVLGVISPLKSTALKEYVKFVAEGQENVTVLDIAEDRLEEAKRSPEFISTKQQAVEKIKNSLDSRNLTFNELIKDMKTRNELIQSIRKNSALSLSQIGDVFGGLSESRISRILSKSE